MMTLWWLLGAAIAIAIAALVVPLLRRDVPAEELLRQRFARGELDREAYEDMARELRDTGTHAPT